MNLSLELEHPPVLDAKLFGWVVLDSDGRKPLGPGDFNVSE